jgi:predicted DNA-binding transcriptional regulator YafY
MLSLGKERLSGRVSVEDIPSGHIHLTAIMEAMTSNNEIIIEYMKYTSNEVSSYTLRPYAVKESARRWYVIGYCIERKQLRVFGLDRVHQLRISDRTFRMPAGFDVDEAFATSFGPYLPEGPGRTIVFRAKETEARFLRDLPIHPSQKEIKISKTGGLSDRTVTFEIFASLNKAMIMEFCKHGSGIEVISPADVREAVAKELAAAAGLYGKP